MSEDTSTYKLAMTLHGHSADVKALNAPSPDVPLLLSGSRDGSAIVWGPGRDGLWEVKLRAQGPEGKYVNSVAMVRKDGQAHLLVGSVNGVLSVFPLPSFDAPTPDGTAEAERTLIEHKANLSCLDTTAKGLIATGSWDHTVKIWKDWKVALTIKDHTNAVWSVKFIGEDRRILTAGSDNKIILHSFDVKTGKSTVLQEYTGHEQPVRGVSLTKDGKGFWSCSNDASVNIYSFDKDTPLKRLYGHNSFVYTIQNGPDGAVTSGEDGTIRVWSDDGLQDTIAHPTSSIWACALVPAGNGSTYIASAADDGNIRLFTRDQSLFAPAIERERYDAEVSSRALDKSQVGDVKQSDLPGLEALGREGKKEGQTIMIKNKGVIEAYSWQSRTRTWQAMGRVVDAVGSKRKQVFEGKEYDYVWDVDISEGMPPLKLPYNVTDNPFIAAHNWSVKHDVPLSYLDQIVAFIEKNTEGVKLGQGSSDGYVDPYTGATRYTGSSASGSTSAGGGDPFTGGGAYSTTPVAPPTPKGVLPVKTILTFMTVNAEAIRKKISELNGNIKSASPDLALTDDEEKQLAQAYAIASKTSKGPLNVNSVVSLIKRWPAESRFPLLDLARYLAGVSADFAEIDPSFWLDVCEWDAPWTASKPRDTNTLLALRGLANQFNNPKGKEKLVQSANQLLERLTSTRKWDEIGARRVPFVTIALNYSVLAVDGALNAENGQALLDMIAFVVKNESSDGETLYRALVALGNVSLSPSILGSIDAGELAQVQSEAIKKARNHSEQRLKDIAGELERMQ